VSTQSGRADKPAPGALVRPLTILHLISHMHPGGRAATALRQARLLAGCGHRVLVGCVRGSAAEERARAMGLQVFADFRFRRGFRPAGFWHDCRLVASRCNIHGVDIVHTHHSAESWVGCVGVWLASRRPALIRSRGIVVPVKPHLFNRLLHNQLSDCVVAPSHVIYDQLRALPGFDPGKVALIPDAVDTTRFHPQTDGQPVREEFGVPRDAPFVVMVARLEPVKGHEVFLTALAQLAQTMPDLRALCACDERAPGVLAATVERARAAGLGERTLVFTGLRTDVERVIAAASVIALPSLGSEGSSRVALEAAASGVPVVASAVGCLPEVVEEGVTGMLVPPGDPRALVEALRLLLHDPALARQMGRAARARAETLYHERLMAERLEGLYRRAGERRKGLR